MGNHNQSILKPKNEINLKLDIYYMDETSPKSPIVLGFDSPTRMNSQKLQVFKKRLKNKEDIFKTPLKMKDDKMKMIDDIDVYFRIMCFLSPVELRSVFLVNNFFYWEFWMSNRFWKEYFFSFFKDEKEGDYQKNSNSNNNNEDFRNDDDEEGVNYKKLFYSKYRKRGADEYFRNKHLPEFSMQRALEYDVIDDDEEGEEKEKEEEVGGLLKLKYYIIGGKRIGKKSLLDQLVFRMCREEGGSLSDMKIFLSRGFVEECDVHVISSAEYENEGALSKLIEFTTNTRILLCFALDDRKSFQMLEKKYWKKIEEKMEMIRLKFDTSRHFALLVGLKSDIKSEDRKVTREMIEMFIRKKKLKGYVETSPKLNSNCYFPFAVMNEKGSFNEYLTTSLFVS